MFIEFDAYCYTCNCLVKTQQSLAHLGQRECPVCKQQWLEWLNMTAMWQIIKNFGARITELERAEKAHRIDVLSVGDKFIVVKKEGC